MSVLEAIAVHRQALERTIQIRKGRLKMRQQRLKAELQARLTPQGLATQFPITTLFVGFGVGWLIGRAVRALISGHRLPSLQPQNPTVKCPRLRAQSPVIQTLKDIALQTLTRLALNKMREFFVTHRTSQS